MSEEKPASDAVGCEGCRGGVEAPFDFTMAFQPIVDITQKSVFAYEALVRGVDGAGAGAILSQVTAENRYAFDQSCRVKAIELATELGLVESGGYLSINFLPNAVYQAETCIRASLAAARENGFPHERLMFEITEGEKIDDQDHVLSIINEYHRQGLQTAIDDFGAGYAGLNLLAVFQPRVIKLDMALTRGIDSRPVQKTIVESILSVADQLSIRVIAEGIETREELSTLHEMGVTLFQGFLFARPEVERLPLPSYP